MRRTNRDCAAAPGACRRRGPIVSFGSTAAPVEREAAVVAKDRVIDDASERLRSHRVRHLPDDHRPWDGPPARELDDSRRVPRDTRDVSCPSQGAPVPCESLPPGGLAVPTTACDHQRAVVRDSGLVSIASLMRPPFPVASKPSVHGGCTPSTGDPTRTSCPCGGNKSGYCHPPSRRRTPRTAVDGPAEVSSPESTCPPTQTSPSDQDGDPNKSPSLTMSPAVKLAARRGATAAPFGRCCARRCGTTRTSASFR